MQQAGLNVNGQAGGNVAAAPSGASVGSASVGLPSSSNPFAGLSLDIFGKMMDLQIQEAQKNLLDTQSENVQADTEGKQIDNEWKDPLSRAQKEALEAQKAAREAEIAKYAKDNELTDEQIANLHKATEWMDTLNQAEVDKVKAATADLWKSVEKAEQEMQESKSRISLNLQLSAESKARQNKESQEAYGIALDNQLKGYRNTLVKAGISPDSADAYSTQMRNILLNADSYGGAKKAGELIQVLLDEQRKNVFFESRYKNPWTIIGNLGTTLHNLTVPSFMDFMRRTNGRVANTHTFPQLR